jgi:dynein heavy chain
VPELRAFQTPTQMSSAPSPSAFSCGREQILCLGDDEIEVHKNYRLYLHTKLPNPHYPPELCVKVNLLNFMATADGLQDQMLGRVVAMEQKELEAQRQQLILEDAENQRQLKEIEDKILFLLKNAEGNILDDEVLIDTLGDSKKTSNIIQEKVKIAETTQVRIAKVRQGYVPVAFQASQLFFCIADLAAVDPMYQYSLDWYISLYEKSIDEAEKAKSLEDRLRNLNDCFTYMLYKNVCRSLFEKDKLLFSFMLTTKIMIGRNTLDPTELRFFLAGSTSMDAAEPNPYKGWLSDKAWNDVLAMCALPAFAHFKESFKTNHAKWEEVINSNSPLDMVNALCGDVAKIGLGAAMKSKWLKKDGDSILRAAASVVDETAAQLASVAAGTSTLSEDDLKNLKRRKLVNQVVRKSFKLTKGPEYQPVRTRR